MMVYAALETAVLEAAALLSAVLTGWCYLLFLTFIYCYFLGYFLSLQSAS